MEQQIILSPNDLSKMLGKGRGTIYRWEREGKLPPRIHLTPGSTGWLRSTIDEWINEKALNNDIS